MHNYLRLFLLFLIFHARLHADDSGLERAVAVDITADTDVHGESNISSDRLFVREAEVMFSGPVDHLFYGQLSIAAHPEAGMSVFEVHEAFITSNRLVPRSRIKLGRFFLGVGRLNQIHRHDWVFIEAPFVHRQFFDDEAAIDSGVEWSTLLPLPFVVDVSLGVTNGYTFGHAHDAGSKPIKPTRYARVASFAWGNTALGLNWLGRTDSERVTTDLVGFDLTFKKRRGKYIDWLVQGEVWGRRRKQPSREADVSAGSYVYVQKALSADLFTGFRYDYYTVTSTKDLFGARLANHNSAIEASLVWSASEFSRLRLAYQDGRDFLEGDYDRKFARVLLQTTFIMGAHPAHDF